MKTTKLFAVLSAAMLGCCALGGTAFAEEAEPVDYSQYQLGDVTMDGKVDIEDAQLALQCYTDALAYRPFDYTPYEQQLLACVKGFVVSYHIEYAQEDRTRDSIEVITIEEVQSISEYYVQCGLAKKSDLPYEKWLESQELDQAAFARIYQDAVNASEFTVYSTDRNSGERYVEYYGTATVQKVRE
ncbi:MAG: hypothetical protein IJ060_05030 [Oscillospiraceae bacterium]|nr:hypothetical protein [Oscillospiraceae bacterium]